MKKKYFIIPNKIIIFSLLFLFIFSNAAYSLPINYTYNNEVYERNLYLRKNITFDGVYDSYSWNFDIDKRTKASEINLSLAFEVTDVMNLGEGSYMTFLVNGTQFYSKKLELNNGEVQGINLKLPLDLIKEGSNELRIQGYIRISDKPCTDDFNTANWLVLREGSSINIKQYNSIPSNVIGDFPYPFVNQGGYNETVIIIPDEYTDYELSSALKVEVLIGREGGKTYLIKAGDIKDLDNSNIIYIGREDVMPKNLRDSLDNLGDINSTSLVKLVKSPLSSKEYVKFMAIVSNKSEELNSAVKFLMNKDLVNQAYSNSISINSSMDLDSKIVGNKNVFSFKELGYGEYHVEGLFRHDIILSHLLPQNRRISVGDKININMRYSNNLDFDRSLLTIYINGKPIGSKKLQKEKSDDDNFEVTIPLDVANTSYVELNMAFDLHQKGIDCEVNNYKQPWALVREDSSLQIDSRKVDEYYFDTYPAPFIEDWDMNNVLFVLPDKLSSKELTGIGNMALYMGRSTKYNLGSLESIRISNLKNEHKDKNVIIYGTPSSNNLIKKINDNLWFKYDDSFNKFLSNEKMNLLDNYSENMSTFQLDNSAFNSKKSMLVLTSTKEELLEKSLIFLSNNQEFFKLSGDGTVIDEYGNIRNFKYKKEKKTPAYKTVERMSGESKTLLIIVILIGSFGVVALILYLYKNKIKK